MKIKTRDKIYDVLVKAGYAYNFTDKDGFILPLKNKTRFHIILEDDNTGEMHMDKTVNGKHKLLYIPSVMGVEKDRIKKFDIKLIYNTETKVYDKKYAENLNKIQKTKVIKRNWYNPMRYIKGKFKYINYEME
jgi:hypothetical protein